MQVNHLGLHIIVTFMSRTALLSTCILLTEDLYENAMVKSKFNMPISCPVLGLTLLQFVDLLLRKHVVYYT